METESTNSLYSRSRVRFSQKNYAKSSWDVPFKMARSMQKPKLVHTSDGKLLQPNFADLRAGKVINPPL